MSFSTRSLHNLIPRVENRQGSCMALSASGASKFQVCSLAVEEIISHLLETLKAHNCHDTRIVLCYCAKSTIGCHWYVDIILQMILELKAIA